MAIDVQHALRVAVMEFLRSLDDAGAIDRMDYVQIWWPTEYERDSFRAEYIPTGIDIEVSEVSRVKDSFGE